ncbi:hypothetical protein GGX14DRAFT_559177 [Mycena pura]|uniref:Uncharacterized protein n=1 Tax=Mycena pura TaxID=153505 RepID=A0AAD6YJD6_9AGAR|nr:hypothetical protein GGX14DRAFT_559177 [Mycena pura]
MNSTSEENPVSSSSRFGMRKICSKLLASVKSSKGTESFIPARSRIPSSWRRKKSTPLAAPAVPSFLPFESTIPASLNSSPVGNPSPSGAVVDTLDSWSFPTGPTIIETSASSIQYPSPVVNPSSSGAVDGSLAVMDESPTSGTLDYSGVLGLSSSFDSAAVDPSPSSGAFSSARVIPPSSVVFWGVLGIGEWTIDRANIGWMVADFCYWTYIFTRSPGFDEHRSKFQALRSVRPFFPDGNGIFGEAGCERLQYPLHPSLLHPSFKPDISADAFKAKTLVTLYKLSSTMDHSETLVLLLMCHGSAKDGTYRLWITTGSGLCGEDSFTVEQLEGAIEDCQARIIVVCNACQSARLASKRWTLICAAGPTEYSDALAQSGSGNIRGGVFTLCVTGQAAAEFGVKVPLPRAEGRSLMESCSESDMLIPLPSSPPDHSFGLSTSRLAIHPPSNRPIRPFVDDAQALKDFLLYKPTAFFQIISNSESAEDLAWYYILPTQFTEAMVHETRLYPDNLILLKEFFGEPQRHGGGPQSENGTHSDSDACFQTLVRLASAYLQIDTRFTQESRDSHICADLLQHFENPANPWPLHGWEDDFCALLQRRNIQAVAVQQIARELGWWNGDITSFVQRPGRDYRRARDEMRGAGMAIDRIPERLGRLFEVMGDLEEPSPIEWLVARWVGADRPRVTLEHWEHVVEAVVDSTATSDALIR